MHHRVYPLGKNRFLHVRVAGRVLYDQVNVVDYTVSISTDEILSHLLLDVGLTSLLQLFHVLAHLYDRTFHKQSQSVCRIS